MSPLITATTIPQLFFWRCKQQPEAVALEVKRNGVFQAIHWRQLEEDVYRAAAVLSAWVQPGMRVVHVSENRYEWLISDLAVLALGGVHVPLHATLTLAQLTEQALDATPCCLIRSSPQGLSIPNLPTLCYSQSAQTGELSWHSAIDASDPNQGQRAVHKVAANITPEAIATILYTSGTTGESKGVVLSQRNVTTNAILGYQAFGMTPTMKRFNFLPLSHIFARTCDFYAWLAGGYQLVMAESKDTVVADCQATSPHVLTGVPYFFEKVQRSLHAAGVSESPGVLKKTLGGILEFCCVGGAPLSNETYDYYFSQGIRLYQGYGLTETSPVITTNKPNLDRKGSVGPALPGLQIKIAEDGEICAKGDNVMQGYWQKPEATTAVMQDGWFCTGDIGSLDDDGFLWITGRKKELIVTATGKKVAPTLVESLLNQDPLIAQSFAYGDNQKFLIALIVPDLVQLQERLESMGLSDFNGQEPLHPAVGKLFETAIRQRLVDLSHHEQIQRFCLLKQPFSVETGELTSKLSMRRQVIAERYAQQIQDLYRC